MKRKSFTTLWRQRPVLLAALTLAALTLAAMAGLCRAESAPAGAPPTIIMEGASTPTAEAPTPTAPAPTPTTATAETPTAEASVTKTAATGTAARTGTGAPPRKILTPEEIKELPLFSRYDDETWQKLLAKGKTLLEDVKDETFGYDEEAFYWLVAHVNKLPPELMKPDSEGVAYKILLSQASALRGTPVTIRGVYMSVAPFNVAIQALRKDAPILYECTIRELPMQEARPIATVITTEDPMTYLRAGDEVLVKGYFYKVRQYQGTKGVGLAPMLVAQRLEPIGGMPDDAKRAGARSSAARGDSFGGAMADPYLITMIALIVLMAGGFFYIKSRQRSKNAQHATSQRSYRVHKFRLRRPDLPTPPAGGGPGSPSGGPNP
jgi:hypothetical protein